LYAVHPTFASSCWGKEREGHSREDRGETDQKEDRKKGSNARSLNSKKQIKDCPVIMWKIYKKGA
jgi:hypothetical protein